MIIVRLVGGLANQMFPYAAGRRLAHRWNTVLKMDIRAFAPEVQTRLPFPRQYALGVFNISQEFATEEEIAPFEAVRKQGAFDRLKGLLFRSPEPRRIYYKERHFHFDPRVLKLPDNVYLAGNWVSEKYFHDSEEVIRSEFTFREPPAGRNRELIEQAGTVDSVSIHVRRGDYVASPRIHEIHGVCDIGYYRECVRRIAERLRDPCFFVFSDEPQWAKDNLKLEHPAVYVDHNPPELGHEDLRIMSSCRHHIVANSGFSWWAAWLNRNPGKIVYAPRVWVRAKKHNTRDLVPESWIRV